MARTSLKPEDIYSKVLAEEDRMTALRERMDDDLKLYRLEWSDARDEAQDGGYQVHRSNEPRTFADKIIAWLASAAMVIRIPVDKKDAADRDLDSIRELFIIGSLKSADDHLRRIVQPSVRRQIAWHIALRGWYAGRCTLVKDKDDQVRVEIIPWDPYHTFYQTGEQGLLWACHRIRRTAQQIKNQYGVDIDNSPVMRPDASGGRGADEDRMGTCIYHYYDKERHAIALADRWIKRPTPHNFPNIPVFLGVVGDMPFIQSENIDDTIKDYGESVYSADREVYNTYNESMSDAKTMVRRSVKQGIKVFSQEGTKTLDEDPYKEGSTISLRKNIEDVQPLGLLDMAKETSAFLGLVSGEMQRGSLPHSVYGELQFQLSGFAITTLRQGVDAVLEPRVGALEDAYCQIAQLLTEQYGTGGFGEMTLRGQTYSQDWQQRTFEPSDIQGMECPIVTFLPKLPSDDPSKYAMAQIAREGPVPLLPDRFVLDEILGIQDVDAIQNMIKEQQAERGSPIALLYSLMLAAEQMGRQDLAQIYLGHLMPMVQELMPGAGPGPGTGAGPGPAPMPGPGPGPMPGPAGGMGPAGPTMPPEVAPNAVLGVPPPAPTPQGPMPLVPPGAPRPGAQGPALI